MTDTANIKTTVITFDSPDAEASAAFWAAVAGGTVAEEATSEFATVERPGAVDLTFNQVPEGKTAKNRVHLDLAVEDLPGAVVTAEQLGGSVIAAHDGWTTLADPDGNEFCLIAS